MISINEIKGKGKLIACGVVITLSILFSPYNGMVFAGDAGSVVRIGVLAKRGPERCMAKWGATAEYLTKKIKGRSFVIVPLSFDKVSPAVEKGEVDFILTNPYQYVAVEALYGASRIATLKNIRGGEVQTVYGGVVFYSATRTGIKKLSDLKGKTFMAVDPMSFGGWLMVLRELKEAGIAPHSDFAELSFGGTHDEVVCAVKEGRVDAGSVRTDTLERMEAEGKIRLEDFRMIHDHYGDVHFKFRHSTRIYPEWPFAAVGHTSDKLAERVAVALINMPPDSPSARASRCAGWTIPHNYQPVHECLKYIKAGPYRNYGRVTLKDAVMQYLHLLLGGLALILIAVLLAVYFKGLNRRLHEEVDGHGRELQERKRAENSLKEALGEKELLLKEIHHRIKNNFQIIASLISLQKSRISDEDSLKVLDDIQTRIRTMTLIHEKLYKSKDIKTIDFGDYIERISNELYHMYVSDPDRVKLRIDVENIRLNTEQSIPCGLMLNELLTNAFKYAFPEDWRKPGEIRVLLKQRNDNMVEIEVSDNGSGMPEEIDFNNTETLGLQLVRILSENQLKGAIKLDRQGGSKFTVSFKRD